MSSLSACTMGLLQEASLSYVVLAQISMHAGMLLGQGLCAIRWSGKDDTAYGQLVLDGINGLPAWY